MLENTRGNNTMTQPRPLYLEVSEDGRAQEEEEEEEDRRRNQVDRWWNKILDMEEAKDQIMFLVPMILTNLSYSLITLVPVMFSGHLGQLQLAGATLATSWSSVTGMALMIGLSGALETVCGQAFGAREYEMLGTYLQASCIISTIFSVIISILWFYTQPLLVLLHQSQDISRTASLYLKFLIPGVFAYGFLQNMQRFLQTQSVVMPLVVLSALPLLAHIGFTYALVNCSALNFKGAPIAASVSLWISMVLLAFYVMFSEKFTQTWKGFSFQSFYHILTVLKLALPSAAMICLEDWAFQMLVFLAGILPDSETSTSLIAICVNTEIIAYMICYGLSAVASTRVSNELGAGNTEKAKHAMSVTLKLSLLLAFCVALALSLGHNLWIHLFSNNSTVKHKFASMTPLLTISIVLDFVQGVLSGVAKGCGWQRFVVCVNLATYYLIGIPISCLLGFKLKLHAKGLWIGLICGLSCQTGALLLLTKRVKWTKLSLPDNRQR